MDRVTFDKVAASICAADGGFPDAWQEYEPHARRALENMREPTLAIIAAARRLHPDDWQQRVDQIQRTHRAIIDEILGDRG